MKKEEIWKEVPEFNLYEVSNYGRVRSKDRIIKNVCGSFVKKGRILTPENNGLGYMRVQLKQGSKNRRAYIHRLVAELFIENPEHKRCVNHIDNNPLNNNVLNLEWVTHQENTDWMVAQGRNIRTEMWHANNYKGQSKQYTPVIATNIKTGEEIYFQSMNIVKNRGFRPGDVCRCCKGIRKTHRGHIWRYANP